MHCVTFLKAGQEQKKRANLCFHYLGDRSLCVCYKILLNAAKGMLWVHVCVHGPSAFLTLLIGLGKQQQFHCLVNGSLGE